MFIDEAKKLGNVTLVDFNELEKLPTYIFKQAYQVDSKQRIID